MKPAGIVSLISLGAFIVYLAGCGTSRKGEASNASAGGSAAVSEATFKTEVEEHPGLVLADFWASWCGPCRELSPRVDELARELGDKLKVVKVDVDSAQALSSRLKIDAIPCLILFKDGKEQGRLVGLHTKAELKDWLAKHE